MALARTRTLEVRFRDRAGEPVAGAVVRCGRLTSQLSDRDGRTTITVNPEDLTLVAVALGYRFAEMPVPSEDLTEIVLEKGALLTVRVLTPTGAPAGGVAVRLESDRPVFGGDEGPLEPAGASSPYSSRTGSGQCEFTYRPDMNGELELSGFVEGAQFRLVVLDSLLPEPLHEAEVAITTVDRRTLDIEVPEAIGTVEGRIVDEAGAPVVLALVRVLVDPDRATYSFSDAEGRFRVDDLRATRVNVVASKKGKAPALLERPVAHRLRLVPVGVEGAKVAVRVDFVPDKRDYDVLVPAAGVTETSPSASR